MADLAVLGVHHVAFAEEDDRILRAFTDLLGLTVTHTEDADSFVERMIPVGGCFLQGLQACGDGVVRRSVSRRGAGLHHIAFQVPDVRLAVRELRARNVRMIDEEPRDGGAGTRIAFAHPDSFGGILVEFVEVPGEA
jgi:methylmalonyl-CoA/ethylmalonyl-CoA epimerase